MRLWSYVLGSCAALWCDPASACILSDAAPTTTLPSATPVQRFSFVATDACVRVGFVVPSGSLSKVPVAGMRVGRSARRYTVDLTAAEWESVATETTFTWTITGGTATGATRRLTTTNEIDADYDGWTRTDGDCDDASADAHPGATEVCDDGIDNDCDGRSCDAVDVMTAADAILVGARPHNGAGTAVAGAGDVNGDGNDDLLVGAPYNDYLDGGPGAVHLALGPVTGLLDLGGFSDATLTGAGGDMIGDAIAGVGDLDADGLDDVVIGSRYNDTAGDTLGGAFVFFGPVSGRHDLDAADGTIWGDATHILLGRTVAGAGDVNDDGDDDLIVSSTTPFPDYIGQVHVFLGPVSGELGTADAVMSLEGSLDAVLGIGAGDLDADGFDDVVVGVNDIAGAGTSYVLLGPITGERSLLSADATLVGEAAGDYAFVARRAGDVDGDGNPDILIGAAWAESGKGAAYLVLSPVSGEVDLATAHAKLVGEAVGDLTAYGLDGIGDVDGDGHDDLLVGAPFNGTVGESAGAAYVALGPVTGTVDLASADAKLHGVRARDLLGYSAAGVGDTNADGAPDFLIGASEWDQLTPGDEKWAAGAAFLFSGWER